MFSLRLSETMARRPCSKGSFVVCWGKSGYQFSLGESNSESIIARGLTCLSSLRESVSIVLQLFDRSVCPFETEEKSRRHLLYKQIISRL